MAVYSKPLIDEAASLLNDEAFSYWTTAFHLASLNSGQLQIALIKPDASVVTDSYQLVAGTRQLLPDGTASFQNPSAATLAAATKLIRIVMNMGTNGTTPGRAPLLIDMDLLAATKPTWPADTAAALVKHYMYDPKDPKVFWVSPPQPAASQGYVRVIYNAIPVDVASYAADTPISLPDEYRAPLLNWIMFKAYSRDSDSAHANLALQYYDAFLQGLNLTSQIKVVEDPNVKEPEKSISY